MAAPLRLQTPLTDADLDPLRIGDRVSLSGPIYTARDAAHKRLVDLIERDTDLPFDLAGQVIYYVGPTPAPPGRTIGAAGPTSSYRMDAYAPALMVRGLKGMIGKGARSQAVKTAMQQFKAVYFAAIGGAGALIARSILEAVQIAYSDLGTEAVRRLEVLDFPVIVANDIHGGDLYTEGVAAYASQRY